MGDNRLKIGITQGEPNGIGWEVILKIFADPRMCELCTPVIYGTAKAAEVYRRTIRESECNVHFNACRSAEEARRGRVNLVACGDPELRIDAGQPSTATAHAAAEALETAVKDLAAQTIDALVTGPIDKNTIQSETFNFTGHTEFLAARLGGEPMMIMCSDRLRVGLVTCHLPLSEVSGAITEELILGRLAQLRRSLKEDFGVVEPRIAVLALNPHAGDEGLLGDEERDIIKPAVVKAFKEGTLAFGPFPADGFFAAGRYADYDAVLAMYHDQGLTPFKTLAADGVNFTAGLSYVRTSPDHGVAYDIAGKDKADPQSMRNAIYAAIDIVGRRRAWTEWTADPLQRFERDKGRDVSVRDLPQTEPDDL